jgi:Lrp/AsnC family transcriptional regulator, leucine-responsive regulatory protein
MLDTTDSRALAVLAQDGRISWAELGAALGLSAPAAAERVRRLQERGLIRGFTAAVDPGAAGFPVLAFVAVTLARQDARRRFLDGVRAHPLILECHHVAGDDDFVLKVRARTLAELDALLSSELKGRLGIARTRTTVVLGTARGRRADAAPAPAHAGRVDWRSPLKEPGRCVDDSRSRWGPRPRC